MKIPGVVLIIVAVVSICATGSRAQTVPGNSLDWAYPVPDPLATASADPSPKQLPGSSKSYTRAQIDDGFSPPDWYPTEHEQLPKLVESGLQAQACGSCHLMSGLGHPESASLAGLPVEYMIRQMEDFKNNLRTDPPAQAKSLRAARMNLIAAALPEDEMKQAVEWFARLKPSVWYRVVETGTVPKSWVSATRMRLPAPEGGTEPIGHRIITLPQDPARVELRDPHSGFTAYVPVGSLKRGEELVTKGGAGRTTPCEICHGEGLKGLGDIPRLAGVHPVYIIRQLYDIQVGANTSSAAAPMKKVVDKLTEDDMIAIAAYAASLAP